jgi:hypothetical protein
MNQSILLILTLLLVLVISSFYSIHGFKENYTPYPLGTDSMVLTPDQSYPNVQTDVLLDGSFPMTGRKGVSHDQGSQIWWHYPIFEVGSYAQVTNNLKFSNNPDTGRCMPADVCGTLYKEYQTQSNYVYPLPPVKPECGSRINYYTSTTSFLHLRAYTTNILY